MKLDVGCGRHKKRGYVGVDFEGNMDVIASADALPFKDNSFIDVFTQECIIEAEFEGDERRAIAELSRVLKPLETLTYNCWIGEPYRHFIKLHKVGGVGTYTPAWYAGVSRKEVRASTFRSYTYRKEV